MANPPGTKRARWNQAVSAIVSEMGWTDAQADSWLNLVWDGMFVDETAGDLIAHDRLKKWLEFNDPVSGTLPHAFRLWVV